MPALLQQPFPTGRLEFTQYISPDGTVYRFNNQIDKFKIAGVSGMGMPTVTYRTQRGPFQDGVTPLGFQFEPRIIQLLHRRNGGNRDEYWDNRSDIINLLRPNRQVGTTFITGVLRKILPDNTKRDLDVFIFDSLAFEGTVQERWDEFSYTEAIQFIAHNPMFYNPEERLEEITLPTYGDELAFPITFPILFSSDATVPIHSITYTGTYKAFPVIYLTGPMEDVNIRNITTDEKLQLEYTIPANSTVVIDLGFGNKTVVDDLGVNRIGSLTTDSDLGSFHLAPDPEAAGGVNELGLNLRGTDANSLIVFKWFTRYIGI